MLSSKAKIGLLFFAAAIIAGLVIVNLGNVNLKKGYEFYILFDDLADLPSRSAVKISGVDVGRVKKVELYQGRARVKVWINADVSTHRDLKAKILKMGLIGNTFISLTRGTEDAPLIANGDTVEGINPISYEEVIDSFVSGLDKVVKVFDSIAEKKNLGEDIGQTFANLRQLSNGLNNAMGDDGRKIEMAVDNINSVIRNFNTVLTDQVSYVSESIHKLGQAADELKMLIAGIREGKGAAGKFLTSDEYSKKIGETIDSIYEASQDLKQAVNRYKGFDTQLDSEVSYESKEDIFRSNAYLTLRTSSDRYLSVGVDNIREPAADIYDEGGDRANALTVTAGKRLGNFIVFGGAIRSSGGMGATLELMRQRLFFETEMFGFNREYPWLNVSSKFKLTEYLKLGVSYEDILDDQNLRPGVEIQIK